MKRLMLCLLAGLSLGAGPPARLPPEQARSLRERPWFVVNEKTLDIELRVYGPWHVQVEGTANRLAERYSVLGEWAKEAKCRRVAFEARKRLDGEGHWRAVNSGWAL